MPEDGSGLCGGYFVGEQIGVGFDSFHFTSDSIHNLKPLVFYSLSFMYSLALRRHAMHVQFYHGHPLFIASKVEKKFFQC